MVKAANVNVEPYWPSLFAKLAEKKNLDDITANVGCGGGGAPVAAAAPAASATAAAPAADEKKVRKSLYLSAWISLLLRKFVALLQRNASSDYYRL